ncbi:hypothetical protein OO009_04680 [Flavobacteriaceae bacterium KMM 6897]|nr:hypothetical protein [Flavobacteriaceae bacterium KMM 6897]
MIKDDLKGHFLNLYTLALSDNKFDDKELQMILTIGEEKGISRTEFEQIIINPTSFNIKYPSDFLSKIELLYDFTRLIWANQIVEDDERNAFMKFCEKFGFQKEESKELFEWLLTLAKNNTPSSNLETEISKLSN